jgi:hypothetical protein
MQGKLLLTLGLVLLASAAPLARGQRGRAAEPPAPYCMPASALPGATTEITFTNAPAGEPTGLWTSFPAEVEVLPGGTGTRCRLKLPADAPVGIGALRLATAGGVGSLQLFMIDDLPSVAGSAKNHTPATAQGITDLCAVDGASEPLACDYYRLTARRGQRIAFEVVAQRLGSRMDPMVRLLDSAGRELEYVEDTPGLGADVRFAHTFERGGEYVIEVRDANYEGSPDHRYRLRVGDFPAVTVASPPGVKRGVEGAFEFSAPSGEHVGPLHVRLPADARCFQFGVKFPGGRSSAFVPIRCGDREEFVAAAPNLTPDAAAHLALPASVGGRFDVPGQRHFYEIAGRKGQRIVLRGQSRRWNAPVDLFFQAYKPDGTRSAQSKVVEPKPPAKGAIPPPPDEGTLEFTCPVDGTCRFSVEDLTQAGGPTMTYHFDVEPAVPDYALSVEVDKVEAAAGGKFRVKVKAERQGYDGPITLALRGAAAAFPIDKNTIPAGKTEADVEVTVPADMPATAAPLQFTIAGTGGPPGEHVASTYSTLRRLFPRLTFVPSELDGLIALRIRPPSPK